MLTMCDTNESWKTTDGPAAFSLKESMAQQFFFVEGIFISRDGKRAHLDSFVSNVVTHFLHHAYFGYVVIYCASLQQIT